MGFQILSPIQDDAPLGLSTCTLSPVNACSFFVPRSRSLMSACCVAQLAAFRAALVSQGTLQASLSADLQKVYLLEL